MHSNFEFQICILGSSRRRDNNRQSNREDQPSGSLVYTCPGLRRDRFADPVRAVSRGRAAETQGGGAHREPARDRRDQQSDARIPRSIFRRHWRDQVRGPRADQRQGRRVAGGRQGRDYSWSFVHRRGPHARYRVFLLFKQGFGK